MLRIDEKEGWWLDRRTNGIRWNGRMTWWRRRLEEEVDPGKCHMTWHFIQTVIRKIVLCITLYFSNFVPYLVLCWNCLHIVLRNVTIIYNPQTCLTGSAGAAVRRLSFPSCLALCNYGPIHFTVDIWIYWVLVRRIVTCNADKLIQLINASYSKLLIFSVKTF